jgi:hypothetical protein
MDINYRIIFIKHESKDGIFMFIQKTFRTAGVTHDCLSIISDFITEDTGGRRITTSFS